MRTERPFCFDFYLVVFPFYVYRVVHAPNEPPRYMFLQKVYDFHCEIIDFL